ncbi:MAG: hypothetical protein HUJ60_05165 [Bacilli bacterium]|nr:hypothetical protein [Bacilli bacterium]
MRKQKLTRCEKNRREINRRYVSSLIGIGRRSDTHIYDLDFFYCHKRGGEKEIKFLSCLVQCYGESNNFERNMMIRSVLEPDRHYPYWYADMFGHREYNRRLSRYLDYAIARLKEAGAW